MRKSTRKRVLLVIILPFFLLFALILTLRLSSEKDPYEPIKPYAFSIVAWEISNAPAKWFYEARHRLQHPPLSLEQEKKLVEEYIELTQRLKRLEAEGYAAGNHASEKVSTVAVQQREEIMRRREEISPQLEIVLQRRLSRLLIEEGFTPHLSAGVSFLLPPLSFKFSPAPHVLAISPRHKIELKRTFLLEPVLAGEIITKLESEIEKLDLSAYIERTGGIATYPSQVPPIESLDSTLSAIAHEWFHQYLFFRPLGRRYGSSYEMTTINETVASMAGDEIGARAHFLYYGVSEEKPEGPHQTTSEFDFAAAMRDIRRQVDEYLESGQFEEAEKFMEEQRQFLATKGYRLRRLNQAYFAFHSSYADDPAFTSAIGQQLEELRRRSTSLADFIKDVSQITDPDGLPKLLESH